MTAEALRYLEPQLVNADDNVLAIAGALQFEAGYTSARRGENGAAWGWWDKAEKTAKKLPADFYHPITSFGRAIMGAHAVTVAVELHQGGESVRQTARTDETVIKSRPRRARHRIEEARGISWTGSPMSRSPRWTRRLRPLRKRFDTTGTPGGSCWRRRSRSSLTGAGVRRNWRSSWDFWRPEHGAGSLPHVPFLRPYGHVCRRVTVTVEA